MSKGWHAGGIHIPLVTMPRVICTPEWFFNRLVGGREGVGVAHIITHCKATKQDWKYRYIIMMKCNKPIGFFQLAYELLKDAFN